MQELPGQRSRVLRPPRPRTPTGARAIGAHVRVNVLTGGAPYELSVDSAWTKALAAFSAQEQTQLQAFVDAMHAHLEATWPLPPWPA